MSLPAAIFLGAFLVAITIAWGLDDVVKAIRDLKKREDDES